MGEDYTEERITQRIRGIAIDRGPRRRSAGEISLRIALEDSIKAQQSAGYARWAKVHNLKQAAKALNFLTEHQIESYEGLESRLNEISAANDEAAAALKAVERRLGAVSYTHLDVYKRQELMFAFGFSAEGLLKLPFFLKNISKSFLKTLDISPECYTTHSVGMIPMRKRTLSR